MQNKLIKVPDKLWSLLEMENTGGEPDVIAYDQQKDEYLFALLRHLKVVEAFAMIVRL